MKPPRRRTVRPWSVEDDNRFRALAENGRSAALIAERLKRTIGSVYKRAIKLGLSLKMVARRATAEGK